MYVNTSSGFPPSFQCYKPPHHKVYGAVCISSTNKVLLVKGRKTGKWSFPKGHKHRKETYIECALRELLEETGITLQGNTSISSTKLSVGEYYFFEVEEEIEPNIRDTNEIMEARWVDIDDIRELSCNVDVNNFLDRLQKIKKLETGKED